MTDSDSLALVGATGGAGTTRLTVEFGATLARAGRRVALLDAAFATQGLASHVPGRIDPDVTALLTDDREADLAAGLVDHPSSEALPGRLALCPAHASFERLARAKTPDAARRFESLLADATARFHHVLVDVPPVAANQSVAAATAADRVALVVPATAHGADHLPRARDRLRDVGTTVDAVIANRNADGGPIQGADAAVPESETTGVADLPVCADPDAEFAPAVADAVETCLGTTLDLSFPDSGLLDDLGR